MQKETTLTEAKIMLRKRLKDGATCPCCNQHVQMYHRPITSAMVYALMLLYKHSRSQYSFVHVEDLLKSLDCPSSIRGDFSKLRFWDMIQPRENNDEGKRNSGYYKILHRGVEFIEGRLMVPSHVILYNNTKFGYSDKMISVHDAIKNKFNYSKLLNQTL